MTIERPELMRRLGQLTTDVAEVIATELRNAIALRNKARLTLVFADSREARTEEAGFARMVERLRAALIKVDKDGRFDPSTGEPK
jgi:hypothetical protein